MRVTKMHRMVRLWYYAGWQFMPALAHFHDRKSSWLPINEASISRVTFELTFPFATCDAPAALEKREPALEFKE